MMEDRSGVREGVKDDGGKERCKGMSEG